MKLLRVISTMDPRVGGPAAGLRAVTPALAALGHSSEFATMEAPSAPEDAALGCPVHRLGPPTNSYQYTAKLLPWLRANHSRFDAVTVHGLWQYHGRAVRLALRGTGTPYFVYPHGMLDPWFRKAYPLKHLKKWAYWLLAERRVLRDAAAVLFTCEQERLLARTSFSPYACTERVVQYGSAAPSLDLAAAREEFRRSLPALGASPYLLYLGRIHPKKGVDLLLAAYDALVRESTGAAPRLVVAGPCEDPSFLASLQARGRATGGRGAVLWPGMLQGALKWGALAGAEAFVLPSHQENFGIAVAESLAAGTPVLISDQVNIWREITGDGAGIANPDTEEGTLASLRAWAALAPARRAAMAQAASACFARRFEMGAVASSLVETLRGAGAKDSR